MYSSTSGPPRWQTSPACVRAVVGAGGLPVPIPLTADSAVVDAYLMTVDGLLFTGGGDIAPERYGATNEGLSLGIDLPRDEVELYLAERAPGLGIPMLGLCRGAQVLNVAAGGTLIQDIPSQVRTTVRHRTPADLPRDTVAHRVMLHGSLPDSVPAELRAAWDRSEPVGVNSTHHQAAERVGAGYAVVGLSGDGIIEALVGTEGVFRMAIQWHPEELVAERYDPLHRLLFAALVDAARRRGGHS